MEPEDILHIYGQLEWHAPAVIIGNREALIRLRVAISMAIEEKVSRASFMQNDGEGFHLFVGCTDKPGELQSAYVDEDANDTSGKDPLNILQKLEPRMFDAGPVIEDNEDDEDAGEPAL